MIIRIFPRSKKEFKYEEELRDWLDSELKSERNGRYRLRTTNGVGSIPPGSIVLFRFKRNIVGEAVVKKDVKKIHEVINGHKYEGRIKFVPSSIQVYEEPLPIKFLEEITGRSFSFGQAYYKIEDENVYTQIAAKTNPEAKVKSVDNIDQLKPTRKAIYTVQRIIRDSKIARDLKTLYQYQCQICKNTLETKEGKLYAEVHHLQPVGKPHNGNDGQSNMIVVCPQHHAMFDLGIISINPETLKVEHWNQNANEYNISLILNHKLDEDCLKYHYTKIFDSANSK